MPKIDRQAVYAKCGGRCAYCGTPIDFKAMQVDHVRPVVARGTDDFDNLLPACRPCNNYKLFFELEYFRGMVKDQINLLRRNSTNFRTAERFGFVTHSIPEPFLFYFERQSQET